MERTVDCVAGHDLLWVEELVFSAAPSPFGARPVDQLHNCVVSNFELGNTFTNCHYNARTLEMSGCSADM